MQYSDQDTPSIQPDTKSPSVCTKDLKRFFARVLSGLYSSDFCIFRGMKRKVLRMAQIYGIDDLKSKHLCDSPQTYHKQSFLSSIVGFKSL